MRRRRLGATLCLLAGVASVGCAHDEPIRVRAAPEYPNEPATAWRLMTMADERMYSNGRFRIPEAGGRRRRADAPRDEHLDAPDQDVDERLNELLSELTDGLEPAAWLDASGWLDLDPGDVLDGMPGVIIDVEHDAHDAHLDVALLWRADWVQPGESADVDVLMMLGGDLEDDDPRDPVLLRLIGTVASIERLLEDMTADWSTVEIVAPRMGLAVTPWN